MENKTDASLQILSVVPKEMLEMSQEYLALLGFDQAGNWEVIVKYHGDIEKIAQQEGGAAQIINEQFATLTLPPERINDLLKYPEVEYIETPKQLFYMIDSSMKESCITSVQDNPPYRLRGEGVLLGIVDSGINYFHPDFRNEDGTTRIAAIWDQTISGNPPEGFLQGSEYTREQINEALSKPNQLEGKLIVPSEDTNGHGTHVAGIAGGNGRGSQGRYVGAAPQAEYIIVKLGQPDYEGFVKNIELMLGVKYVIEKARALNKPVAINLSIGTNLGPHDGTSLLEQYLDDAATLWKNNIIVGTGNQGNARNHTSGRVEEQGATSFEFQIGESSFNYALSLWHNPIDQMAIEIVSPNGQRTPRIVYAQGPVRFSLGETSVYATFAGPSPLNGNIEFALLLMPNQGVGDLTSGAWRVIVYGENIVDGSFEVWSTISETRMDSDYFLSPNVEGTITNPGTAQLAIAVGAYNSVTQQLAPFSGRGEIRNAAYQKPDLVAPGVSIVSASHTTSGYRTLSGTSMATPHVTGGAALLMEWGIVKGNSPFLYGENLRTYLIRGAIRTSAIEYPSPLWGYGRLCIKESLDLLRRQLIF